MKPHFTAVSIAALCAASPALADITAAELWAEWEADFAAMGMTSSADVVDTGNGLSIQNLTMQSTATPEISVNQTFSQMDLTNNGDGTVSLEFASPWRVVYEITEGGDSGTIEVLISLDGDTHIVSGDVSNYTYSSTIEQMNVTMGEIVGPDGVAPELDLQFRALDFDGSATISGPRGSRDMSTDYGLGGVVMEMDVRAPAGEKGEASVNFSMGPSIASAAFGYDEMIAWMDEIASYQPGQQPPVYDAGDLAVDIQYDSFAMALAFDDGSESFQGSINGGRGHYVAAMAEALDYSFGISDFAVSATGSELPVPVDFTAELMEIGVQMPLTASPNPADFGIDLSFESLALNDQIWSMMDPSGMIPRDPMTMQLDLTGTAVLTSDLMAMDPTQFTGPPGELRSATLNNLFVSGAGAELTGSGAVEFQPGGFLPMPVGSVDLGVSGLNGLLNNLVAAGLLPPEQVDMVQAMSGIFARPGPGPDTLESTIEFTPGGGITANGTPIR